MRFLAAEPPSRARSRGRSRRRAQAGVPARSARRRTSRLRATDARAVARGAAGSCGPRKFRNGRTLAACFPNGGRRIAATYPLYDARAEARRDAGDGDQPVPQDAQRAALRRRRIPATMGAVVAYVRSLANGPEDRGARAAGRAGALRAGPAPLLHAHGPAQLRVRLVPRAGRRQALRGFGALGRGIGQATHWPIDPRRPWPSRCRRACANASSAWAPRRSRRAPTS